MLSVTRAAYPVMCSRCNQHAMVSMQAILEHLRPSVAVAPALSIYAKPEACALLACVRA